MSDISKNLGHKIKTIRKARNLTQSELAEMIDIDSKYISRIETGLSSPSLKTLEKLCEILKIDIGYLFDFSEFDDKDAIIKKLDDKIKIYSLEKLKLLLGFTNIIDTK